MRWVLRHLGRERQYTIAERELVVFSENGERRVSLDAIRSVRIARIGNLEICALTLDRGEDSIATDESASRAAFGELVRALYAKRPDVPWVSGSWLVAGIIATSCAVLLAIGLALYFGVIDVPALHTRGIVMAVVCTLLGPIGAYRARPRVLRSQRELVAVLPR